MLYKVIFQKELVVSATSENNAHDVFQRFVNEDDSEPVVTEITRINTIRDLPFGWDERCIPWGETEAKIGDILGNAHAHLLTRLRGTWGNPSPSITPPTGMSECMHEAATCIEQLVNQVNGLKCALVASGMDQESVDKIVSNLKG